jgi:hypothetical protein
MIFPFIGGINPAGEEIEEIKEAFPKLQFLGKLP